MHCNHHGWQFNQLDPAAAYEESQKEEQLIRKKRQHEVLLRTPRDQPLFLTSQASWNPSKSNRHSLCCCMFPASVPTKGSPQCCQDESWCALDNRQPHPMTARSTTAYWWCFCSYYWWLCLVGSGGRSPNDVAAKLQPLLLLSPFLGSLAVSCLTSKSGHHPKREETRMPMPNCSACGSEILTLGYQHHSNTSHGTILLHFLARGCYVRNKFSN